MLLPNKEQCAHIKTFYCESAIGQMVNGLAGPFSLMSGGLIKNRCLKNSILNDLKKGADTPAGAAAAIAADAAEAKARRESVRALGLVDCNYWPEAIDVLVMSLRKDRSECVRFEAALALGNGCCCNKTTVKALEMSVSGSNADGFPAERSDRVRAAAAEALARCPIIETEEGKTNGKPLTRNMLSPNVNPAEYYKTKVAQMTDEQIIASARGTLANVQQAQATRAPNEPTGVVNASSAPAYHQRPGTLAGIVANAFGGSADPQTRTPFFAGLTRSLTGKQENTVQQYVIPSGVNATRMPEIQTVVPNEITAPKALPETTKPQDGPIEFVPSTESVKPTVEKKISTLRDVSPPMPLPMPTTNNVPASKAGDAKSGGDYIQLSAHVRQFQPAKSNEVEMFPAIPMPVPMPVPAAIPTPMPTPSTPTIVPVTFVPSPVALPANVTVIPAQSTTSVVPAPTQVRDTRPALPPEIFQSTTAQPRESRGTVTIEIGNR